MGAPEKYTVVFVDQVSGESFTLSRTPVGSFIDGRGVDGERAQQILHDVIVDQTLEQLEATS